MTDHDELRRLALAATPGPWHLSLHIVRDTYGRTSDRHSICGGNPHATSKPYVAESGQNAAYIAAANPATILALLDEVERLRDIMEAWEAIAFYNSGTEHEPVQSLDHEDYLLLESAFYKARLLQESRQP